MFSQSNAVSVWGTPILDIYLINILAQQIKEITVAVENKICFGITSKK